jgi:hypothetical protein
MKKNIFLSIIIICVIFFSCKKDSTASNNNPCSNIPLSFSANVNPIFQGSCATDLDCHGTGSVSGPGELKTYSQIYSWRATIKDDVASGRMPKNGTLDSLKKLQILCWIDSGAPNN